MSETKIVFSCEGSFGILFFLVHAQDILIVSRPALENKPFVPLRHVRFTPHGVLT